MSGTVSATEQSIFLSPSARDAVAYDSGLIVISGDESSGKSTTLSLMANGYRERGRIPAFVRFGLHNADLPLPEGSDVIMLPFLEAIDHEDEDLRMQQDEVITEAFAHVAESKVPYAFIIDDLPPALTSQAVLLAEAGYPVLISMKASSALIAADKLCDSYGFQGFGSPVQAVLAVSIWQQLLTLTNGKKLLKSYTV
jgi:hypothetical protein